MCIRSQPLCDCYSVNLFQLFLYLKLETSIQLFLHFKFELFFAKVYHHPLVELLICKLYDMNYSLTCSPCDEGDCSLLQQGRRRHLEEITLKVQAIRLLCLSCAVQVFLWKKVRPPTHTPRNQR